MLFFGLEGEVAAAEVGAVEVGGADYAAAGNDEVEVDLNELFAGEAAAPKLRFGLLAELLDFVDGESCQPSDYTVGVVGGRLSQRGSDVRLRGGLFVED